MNFSVPGKGHFQFKRMPFGFTNAPATFQRLIDSLIGPEMEPHAFASMDDIIIGTKTFEDYLIWLNEVITKIKNAALRLNLKKCECCCFEVKYLGYIVNDKGLMVDPDKLIPILEYPVPTNLKEIRRLLGIASWYRRFIPNFSSIAAPLK